MSEIYGDKAAAEDKPSYPITQWKPEQIEKIFLDILITIRMVKDKSNNALEHSRRVEVMGFIGSMVRGNLGSTEKKDIEALVIVSTAIETVIKETDPMLKGYILGIFSHLVHVALDNGSATMVPIVIQSSTLLTSICGCVLVLLGISNWDKEGTKAVSISQLGLGRKLDM